MLVANPATVEERFGRDGRAGWGWWWGAEVVVSAGAGWAEVFVAFAFGAGSRCAEVGVADESPFAWPDFALASSAVAVHVRPGPPHPDPFVHEFHGRPSIQVLTSLSR